MKRFVITALFLAAFGALPARAAVPPQFTLQGVLRDSEGALMSTVANVTVKAGTTIKWTNFDASRVRHSGSHHPRIWKGTFSYRSPNALSSAFVASLSMITTGVSTERTSADQFTG